MGEIEELSVRVVREFCSILAQMFEDDCKEPGKLKDFLEGMTTRSSNARTYLANWGPFYFLSFYFSKAAEALKSKEPKEGGNVNELLAGLLKMERPHVFGALECYKIKKGTDESYLFYSYLILRYHVLRGLLEPKETISNTMISLLEEYSKEKSKKTLKYDEFMALVENLNRLLEIYLIPLEEIKSSDELVRELRIQCSGGV